MGRKWLTTKRGRQHPIDDLLDDVQLGIETALQQKSRVVAAILERAIVALVEQLLPEPILQTSQVNSKFTFSRFQEEAVNE